MNSNNNDNENNGNNESNENNTNNTNNTNNQNNYQIIIEELDNFTINENDVNNENDEIHEFFFTLPIHENNINANIFNTIESILENMQNNTNIINENNNNEYYSFDIEFEIINQNGNEDENNDYFLNSKDIDNRLSKCQKIKKTDKLLDETCFICMDNYKINELKRILPNCSHYFHKKCVDKWLKKRASCPVCRDELIK